MTCTFIPTQRWLEDILGTFSPFSKHVDIGDATLGIHVSAMLAEKPSEKILTHTTYKTLKYTPEYLKFKTVFNLISVQNYGKINSYPAQDKDKQKHLLKTSKQ